MDLRREEPNPRDSRTISVDDIEVSPKIECSNPGGRPEEDIRARTSVAIWSSPCHRPHANGPRYRIGAIGNCSVQSPDPVLPATTGPRELGCPRLQRGVYRIFFGSPAKSGEALRTLSSPEDQALRPDTRTRVRPPSTRLLEGCPYRVVRMKSIVVGRASSGPFQVRPNQALPSYRTPRVITPSQRRIPRLALTNEVTRRPW